ncbi:hypothetical protein ACGFJ4_16355 [Micromonospora chalcea]|uniref:hypothetical protein n=1 Tax=Micromonospora chalcea TaxID=1874 RepID=UPI001265DC7E|nr:hypothetical protein [Micromonospora purpureochromogenes]
MGELLNGRQMMNMGTGNTARRVVGGIALVAAFTATSAGPAHAINTVRTWNSSSNPLIVRDDAGVSQGRGYGTWKVAQTSNGTRSLGNGQLKDDRPTGASVYIHMRTQTNSSLCVTNPVFSCSGDNWGTTDYGDSDRTNSDRWITISQMSQRVNTTASAARGRFQVCEDRRLSPDRCTGATVTTGDTF